DKNILFYHSHDGLIDNFDIDGAMYEDGLAIYQKVYNVRIGSGSIRNCHMRYPIMINNGCHNIHALPDSIIDVYKGEVRIQGYDIRLETLNIDRAFQHSGIFISAFEVSRNGSNNNYIKNLSIKNVDSDYMTAFGVKDDIKNFVVDNLVLENCRQG